MDEQRRHHLWMAHQKEESIRKYAARTKYNNEKPGGLTWLIFAIIIISLVKWVFGRLQTIEWKAGINWLLSRFIDLPFHMFFLLSLCTLLFLIIITKLGSRNRKLMPQLVMTLFVLGVWFAFSFIGNFNKESILESFKGVVDNFLSSLMIFSSSYNEVGFLSKGIGLLFLLSLVYLHIVLISRLFFYILNSLGFYNFLGGENAFLRISFLIFIILFLVYLLFSIAGIIYILI